MMKRWRWAGATLILMCASVMLYPQLPLFARMAGFVSERVLPAASTEPMAASSGQVLDWADALIYMPSTLQAGQAHPLVVSFSPDANARFMVDFWKRLAERHKLIVYSSKIYRNHAPMDLAHMRTYLDRALGELPADRSRVIFTGLSGGGSFSHRLNTAYPGFAYGMIINTGQFWSDGHPQAKQNFERLGAMPTKVVFLASPTDFRYREMQRDHDLLTQWGAFAKWIEFNGGHVYAPERAYDEALKWMLPK